MKSIFTCILFTSSYYLSLTQSPFQGFEHLFTPPLSYVVFPTFDSLTMDGSANENEWQATPWSSSFVDIEGSLKPIPPVNTRFKMLWDAQNLYVYAELEESNIWATKVNHDDIVYHDNDFEVFIDPEGDTHAYYEIEVNALHTIFDLYLDKPYRNLGNPVTTWDVKGLNTGITLDGSINDPRDIDKKWALEMSIPFSSLHFEKPVALPQHNTIWRINFSRVQWDFDIVKDKYQRKTDESGKLLPEHNFVWSPQGVINMHYPERWGYIIFSAEEQGLTSLNFTLPFSESLKPYLWLIYYHQQTYFKKHNHYATRLTALGITSPDILIENESCTLTMEATKNEFTATVQCLVKLETWHITHEGLLTKEQ